METFDLPEEVDLRQVTVSAKQFRFGVGMTRTRYAEQVRAGVVKFSSGEVKYTLPPEIELDRVTVTQKQFALAVGKSPARISVGKCAGKSAVNVFGEYGELLQSRAIMFTSAFHYVKRKISESAREEFGNAESKNVFFRGKR